MSDVFISYARLDEPIANQVAEALRALGYKVWRDDELPAHRAYADVIEERLKSAQAVVVLWSAEAAKSQWVRAEADAARGAGTLIQARLDGGVPPMPFNQIQCADLSGWSGNGEGAGWRKLTASVEALAGPAQATTDDDRPARRELSVCVLPFANMSGDAEQEYFSDGISEDITTDLSKVSALAVTARNTAFTFKGQSVNVCDVARKLGVSHVLEGSVRKAGGRVRITAQLIDGGSGDHVWAERYDRDLTDIFAIQDEISKAIVDALKVKLLPEEKKAIEQRGTTSPEAYNLYLMARQCWFSGNHGDCQREERVVKLCKRAVEVDPDYAEAWVLLAISQSSLHYGFGKSTDDGVAAADRALAINPALAEARAVRSRQLIESHRFREAEAEIAAGLEEKPESWEMNKEGSRCFLRQRKMAEAAVYLEKCISLVDSDYYTWGLLVTCYQAAGDAKNLQRAARTAVAEAEKVLSQDPCNGAAFSVGVHGLAALGDEKRAREWIDRALLMDAGNLNMLYNFGSSLLLLGDREAGLELIEKSLSKAGGTLISWAAIDTDVDSIRDDPRFRSALAEGESRIAARQKGHTEAS